MTAPDGARAVALRSAEETLVTITSVFGAGSREVTEAEGHLAVMRKNGNGSGDLEAFFVAEARLVDVERKARARMEPKAEAPDDSRHSEDSENSEWDLPVPFGEYDLPPFPVSALPNRLGQFVAGLASATQTPPDLAAMVALATVAAACAKKVVVHVRDGWREPVNIFTVTALDPANRKTPVFRAVTAPIVEFEAEEVRRTRPSIAAAIEEKKILEERLKRLRSQAAEGDGGGDDEGDRDPAQDAVELAQQLADLVVPAAPHLIVDDSTPEHIAKTLFEQGGRLAVMSPEGGVFDILAGRYGQGGPNFEVLLKGHAGDDLRVGRIGTGVQYVSAPAVTVGLAVQPEVIRGLFDVPGFRGRGLLARFLYSIPKSPLGRRDVSPNPVPVQVQAAYHADVLALLGLPFATDENGVTAPHILVLSVPAYESLMLFATWVEPQLADGGDFAFMSDWAGKLVGAVARLAALFHMIENATCSSPWEIPISSETIENAATVGRYLIPHARASFAEMGADPVIAEARHLLRWIERAGVSEFTKRDAYQGTKGYFKTVEKMTPGLALLVMHGYIRELEPEKRSGPGRRPSPGYEVNPRPQNSHNPQNRQAAPHCGNTGNSGRGGIHPDPDATACPACGRDSCDGSCQEPAK